MQMRRDPGAGKYVIKSYEPGNVIINKDSYQHSVIVSPTTLISHWSPSNIESLTADDFDAIIALNPEVILLGTGAIHTFPETAVFAKVYELHLGIEVMDTRAACRTFNVLTAEDRNVVAALIV